MNWKIFAAIILFCTKPSMKAQKKGLDRKGSTLDHTRRHVPSRLALPAASGSEFDRSSSCMSAATRAVS